MEIKQYSNTEYDDNNDDGDDDNEDNENNSNVNNNETVTEPGRNKTPYRTAHHH